MPKKMFDADGNEHEVFTADDVKAEREKALTEFQEQHPELANIDQMKKDLADKEAEITKLKDAGNNNGQQRQIIEQKQKEIDDLKKQITDGLTDVKKFVIDRDLDTLTSKLASGDKELEKKLKETMTTTLAAMPRENQEQQLALLQAAYKLNVEQPQPGVFDNIFSSGNIDTNHGGGEDDPQKPSPALQEFAQKYFNISAEDWKKYPPKKYQVWTGKD